jgi:carbon monoxide dehydrogenase subunit G
VPEISESFDVAQPIDRVWAFLQDVPKVMGCLPGLEFTGQPDENVYGGRITIRLGAVTASFEGEATVLESDDAARECRFKGKGVDNRGGSRAQAAFSYRLSDADGATRVTVDADIKLTGKLAQMGRTGIVNDVAHQMTAEFATNLERKLLAEVGGDPGAVPTADDAEVGAGGLSVFRIMMAIVRGRWRALCAVFGRRS